MNSRDLSRCAARAKVIKAMAHPARLLMVEHLAHGEMCVCDLTEIVGSDISTVSKHLAVMKNAGILESEKRGAQVFYRLRMPCLARFFECVDSIAQPSAKEEVKSGSCECRAEG